MRQEAIRHLHISGKGKSMTYAVREETLESIGNYYDSHDSGLNWSSIFTLPVWLKTWWSVFGYQYELCLRSVWQDGKIVGIAPLICRDGAARLMGSPDVCDYLDFIVKPGKEKVFLQTLLPELKRQGINRLELRAQHPDSVVFSGMIATDFSKKYGVQFQREDLSYELLLPSTWDDYLAGIKKKQRHEVRRKLRRLEADAGNFCYRVLDDNAAIEKFTPCFFTLFQQNPEKDGFLTAEMQKYFNLLISNTTRAGLARFGILEIDGVVVAAVFFFDYRDNIYLYNSGYLSDYSALSVGLISKILGLKNSIIKGKKMFSFLKGKEVYKSRLGGIAIPIYTVQVDIK